MKKVIFMGLCLLGMAGAQIGSSADVEGKIMDFCRLADCTHRDTKLAQNEDAEWVWTWRKALGDYPGSALVTTQNTKTKAYTVSLVIPAAHDAYHYGRAAELFVSTFGAGSVTGEEAVNCLKTMKPRPGYIELLSTGQGAHSVCSWLPDAGYGGRPMPTLTVFFF